jgi:hypothetical protein
MPTQTLVDLTADVKNVLPSRHGGVGTITRGGTVLNPTQAVNIIVWRAPFACAVTAIKGYLVGDTGSTVNARKNGSLNHLATDITLNSAGTWIDGGSVENTSYAVGDKLEIMITGVTGSPSQIAVQVELVPA